MQNSHQNLLFISLDEPILMNLQFKSHDELNEFIKKTGIQQYTVENLKLHSDNILVVDNTTVVVSNTKVCASFVRTLCTDIAVKLAKKSLQVFIVWFWRSQVFYLTLPFFVIIMEQDILKFIQNWFEECHDINDITLDTNIRTLNLDSLDFMELISELEKEYNIAGSEQLNMDSTIRDIINYVIRSNNKGNSIQNIYS